MTKARAFTLPAIAFAALVGVGGWAGIAAQDRTDPKAPTFRRVTNAMIEKPDADDW